MLYVVNRELDMVVAKFEAWSATCFEDAEKFCEDQGYEVVEETITAMGDMVWYV